MPDRLHLPDSWRRKVEALLAKHVPEAEVWAYGSRVNGNSHDASDLDLVLRGPNLTRIPSDRLADLRDALDESNIPILVDIHDWARVPDSFKSEFLESSCALRPGGRARYPQPSGKSGGWQMVALGRVVDLILSSVDKKSNPTEQPVILCNYTDVYHNDLIRIDMEFMHATATHREIERCTLRQHDVVITKDSEKHDDIGVPALVRDEIDNLLCGYHLAILRAHTSLDSRYLYYALKTRWVREQFHSYANGVTRFGLRKDDICAIEIPLPPIEQQRSIGRVLLALDERIELTRRVSETLEEMAQALFKSWFVDFEPVRAKIECRWRRGESLPGLPADLYDLFPDDLTPSPLGLIPAGWAIRPLDEIADFRNGLALQKFRSSPDESKLPVVKISHLRAGRPSTDEWASADIPSTSIIDDGDLVFSWSGSLMADIWCGGRAALNQHLFKVTSDTLPRWYILNSIRGHMEHFRSIAAGKATTMGHIKREHLSTALRAVPPEAVSQAAASIIGPMETATVEARLAIRQIAQQRDTLLPRLLMGGVQASV